MNWTTKAIEFTSPHGVVSVNPNADSWCLMDCNPELLREAVENMLAESAKCRDPIFEGWVEHCRAVPTSYKREDFERWIGLAMIPPSGVRQKFRSPITLMLKLRLAGVLLWPSLVHLIEDPFGKVEYTSQTLHFKKGLTPFELKLFVEIENHRTQSESARTLLSQTPVVSADQVSVDALLFSLEVILKSDLRRQMNDKVRKQVVAAIRMCSQLEGLSRSNETLTGVVRKATDLVYIKFEASSGRRRNLNRFGEASLLPGAEPWVSLFEQLSIHFKLRRGYQLDMAMSRLLRCWSSRDRMPCPSEITRASHITGPDGYIAFLKTEISSDINYAKEIAFVASLFELMVDSGLLPRNPIRDSDIPKPERDNHSSNKLVLPYEVSHLAMEVISELTDFSFAQFNALSNQEWTPAGTRNGVRFKRDEELPSSILRPNGFQSLFTTFTGADGTSARILSPVSLVGLQWLLTIPNRGIQVRLIDSGEADELAPKLVAPIGEDQEGSVYAEWVANKHPLATKDRRVGAIREIHDTTLNRGILGFYVNTNKSQEGGHKDGQDRGQEIPMSDAKLLRSVISLRDWQEKLNPVDCLLTREEIGDPVLVPSDGLKGRSPAYTFLFRELADSRLHARSSPITYTRFRFVFNAIMDEVEARLAKRILADEGYSARRPPKIITARVKGVVKLCVYTLHSLRVSGITGMFKAGLPFWIISKIVAGHQSYLMTLRYCKLDQVSVYEALRLAREQMESGELAKETEDASTLTPDELARLYVSDCGSITTEGAQVAGLWLSMEDGICPNGATLCHQGGPEIEGQPRAGVFGPVSGGARNCGLCRFFITGNRFLPGQVARLNAFLYKCQRQSLGLRELHIARRQPENKQRRRQFDDKIERVNAELDVLFSTVNARTRLLYKSLALANLVRAGLARGEDLPPGDLLITRMTEGEIMANLKAVSQLGFLDNISRTAALLPEEDIQEVPILRNVVIDQLLADNGLERIMHCLSRVASRVAGDAFTASVRAQAPIGSDPDDYLDDVAEGRFGLLDLDLARITADVSRAVGRRIEVSSRLVEQDHRRPKLIVAPRSEEGE